MSFFDKLGKLPGKVAKHTVGKLPVISHDFRPGELVWVYPQEMVPYGSRIVVQPNQAAIVIRSGKILGVLKQGEWVLDTAHVPGLRGFMQELYEGVPLPVRIVFVNITEKEVEFGGRGNTKDLIPIQYRGKVHIVVPDNEEDIKRFALKIAGEDKSFTSSELAERMREYINDIVESVLGNFLAIEVQAGKGTVREMIRSQVAREVQENWYLRVKSVAVDVDIPEEWAQKLFEKPLSDQQLLALMASNPQAAQMIQQYLVQRRMFEALGNAQGGNVVGLAAFLPMLQQTVQQARQPQQPQSPQQLQPGQAAAIGAAAMAAAQQGPAVPRQPQGYTPRCPYCGAEIPASLTGAQFCPFCGKKIKWCPNGHVAPAEAKFCPVCGAQLQ